MANSAEHVAYLLDQLAAADGLTARHMFGGHTLYIEGKVVGLICDNQLFIKPTAGAEALLEGVDMGPPYQGAKPCFALGAELDDPDLATKALCAVAADLPPPKPKKKNR